MKIKVCGMKYPENIQKLSELAIDYMGFIFYPKSPRYINDLKPEYLLTMSPHIKKTGVFVDEAEDVILKNADRYALNVIQLHGSESIKLCKSLKDNKLEVIKAFSVMHESDLEQTFSYEGVCDYFLFDTKTPLYGGSGKQFDWNILQYYQGNTPFFLSGGISPENETELKKFSHKKFYGIDLNSQFEIQPGEKNIELIQTFIENLK